jgi:hypothetical protein
MGRARVRSQITTDENMLGFAVLHLGDHNITGGARAFDDENRFHELRDELKNAFDQADTAAVIRILDEHFHKSTFSIRSLFRDEQRRIINLILQDTVSTATASIRGMYENQAPLLRFLNSLSVPIPEAFISVAGVALNGQLQQALERPDVDAAAVQGFIREAQLNHVKLDTTTLEFTMRKRLEAQAAVFEQKPDDLETLKKLNALLDLAKRLPFCVGLATVQEIGFAHLRQAVIGNGHALATAAGNGSTNEITTSLQSPEAAQQEWARELYAVREKLGIQGSQ